MAIDAAGDCAAAFGITHDQRGEPRPGTGSSACDIGAYEFQGCIPDLVLTDEAVVDEQTFEACNTITAGPDFTVAETGIVLFRAGEAVIMVDGFNVEPGGQIDPALKTD